MADPTEGNDVINGTSGDDDLKGLGGDDRINGRAGADRMEGGLGNDTYYVDNVGDRVIERLNQGRDLVRSTIDHTLAANVEDLILSGAAVRGTGNSLANAITGHAGANRLDGRGGADTMKGGLGNDIYYIDDVGDRAIETSAGGNDRVYSRIDYTLRSNLENLTLQGTANLRGTGNELANAITGNAGANRLDGRGGADTMRGGNGNDFYYVDDAGDKAIETSAGGGVDRVYSQISFTLGNHVEQLVLTGAGAINGVGNGLNNRITGNGAANIIDGGTGADTMIGGLGNDIYGVDDAGDIVTEASGGGTRDAIATILSTLTLPNQVEILQYGGSGDFHGIGNNLINVVAGGEGDDILEGGGGGDVLFGGGGTDLLIGGAGGDHYYFATPLGSPIDEVQDFDVANDEFYLDRRIFTQFTTDGTITEAQFHSGAAAHDADDRIVYDPTTGIVYYDADGNGGGAAIGFASVTPGLELSHLHFEALIPVL